MSFLRHLVEFCNAALLAIVLVRAELWCLVQLDAAAPMDPHQSVKLVRFFIGKPFGVHLVAISPKCLLSILQFRRVTHKNAHVWFLVAARLWQRIFIPVNFVDKLHTAIVAIKRHQIDRVLCATSIVVLGWQKNNVVWLQISRLAMVYDVLNFEILSPFEILQAQPIDLLVEISRCHSVQNVLAFFQPWIFWLFNSLNYQVGVMDVFLRVVQMV